MFFEAVQVLTYSTPVRRIVVVMNVNALPCFRIGPPNGDYCEIVFPFNDTQSMEAKFYVSEETAQALMAYVANQMVVAPPKENENEKQ